MKIDLSGIPMIDNHCHPFPKGREPEHFERNFCTGFLNVSPEDMRNTLYFQQTANELRRILGLGQDASIDEIIEKRNEQAIGNRKEYCKKLFEDAGIVAFLSDFGFPISRKHHPELALRQEEIDEYYELCGDVKVGSLDRIEWIANRLLDEELPFDEFEARLVKETKEMIEKRNLIGLKSVVAYYTGTDVRPLSQDEFRKGYYLYLYDRKNWGYEKMIRDFTFIKACEICRDLDIPLQVHTGLGDTPDCHIVRVNPALLTDCLNDPRCKDTTVILIHGGYPYCEELGMMTNHYPNVYADISAVFPFASIGGEEKLRNMLEMAPLNKVLFATDGGLIPENLWFGALNFRRVFTKVLQDLVDAGYVQYDFAMQSAENVMHRNVERIYKRYANCGRYTLL